MNLIINLSIAIFFLYSGLRSPSDKYSPLDISTYMKNNHIKSVTLYDSATNQKYLNYSIIGEHITQEHFNIHYTGKYRKIIINTSSHDTILDSTSGEFIRTTINKNSYKKLIKNQHYFREFYRDSTYKHTIDYSPDGKDTIYYTWEKSSNRSLTKGYYAKGSLVYFKTSKGKSIAYTNFRLQQKLNFDSDNRLLSDNIKIIGAKGKKDFFHRSFIYDAHGQLKQSCHTFQNIGTGRIDTIKTIYIIDKEKLCNYDTLIKGAANSYTNLSLILTIADLTTRQHGKVLFLYNQPGDQSNKHETTDHAMILEPENPVHSLGMIEIRYLEKEKQEFFNTSKVNRHFLQRIIDHNKKRYYINSWHKGRLIGQINSIESKENYMVINCDILEVKSKTFDLSHFNYKTDKVILSEFLNNAVKTGELQDTFYTNGLHSEHFSLGQYFERYIRRQFSPGMSYQFDSIIDNSVRKYISRTIQYRVTPQMTFKEYISYSATEKKESKNEDILLEKYHQVIYRKKSMDNRLHYMLTDSGSLYFERFNDVEYTSTGVYRRDGFSRIKKFNSLTYKTFPQMSFETTYTNSLVEEKSFVNRTPEEYLFRSFNYYFYNSVSIIKNGKEAVLLHVLSNNRIPFYLRIDNDCLLKREKRICSGILFYYNDHESYKLQFSK